MSVNDSFATNDSHPSQSPSSYSFLPQCFDNIIAGYIISAYTFTNIILLLPLSVFVLNLGFQRWMQQRSVSSAAAMSFSDFLTYNIALMELIGVLGYTISICSVYIKHITMLWVGIFIAGFPWNAQMLFPILTCVERYLAVVHPIIYLRLRKGGGVRIRNVSAGLVWLQCFGGVASMDMVLKYPLTSLISCTILVILLIAVTFCSISVLCILIRPRPGEAVGNRGRVDQKKKRAFQTIIIIMGVLMLRFGGNLICSLVGFSPTISSSDKCVGQAVTGWVNLPSSLVLPLLFLHRERKLPGCKHNTESG